MSTNEFQNQPDFDNEPDEIEEGGSHLPSGITKDHRLKEINSLNEVNSYSHGYKEFQVVNDSNYAINNSNEELSPDEERELAGYDEETDELLASKYRIKQENEPAEIRPVSEKASVRMVSVLTGTGVVIGILGFIWFTFFAPKPVSQQAKTSTPEVTPSPPNDESGELKSRLAFQDQQRTLEAQPPVSKEHPTPSPTPTPTPTSKPEPKAVPVARTPQPPRPVQNSNPPPRVVQTVSPPQPPTPPPRPTPSPPRSIPSPPPPPAEKVDPYERWAQLASLGQSRGEVTEDSNTESAIASNWAPITVGTTPTPLPQDQQPTQISATPEAEPGIAAIAIGDTEVASLNSSTNPNRMSAGEAGILSRTPVNPNSNDGIATKEIAIGSSARGRVIVPMIWDEADQSPTAGRFAVQLTEDMKATDGAIALPSGTILIAEVENVTRPNRLVSQTVVAIVYPDSSGRIHQVPIPPGNFLIRGADNQPLIAEGLFDRGSEIAKTDILVGVLSSLGRVGEIINQPTQETFSQQNGVFGNKLLRS
ncbi:hypothetical protein [Coleofasciculus sp. G2-EDA-02]|uniref:hypothetical protein n=1 Tax=Coleofasciculus sp. G2-EDA-02 TaxID=3069529 RepID=UPI0032F3C232